MVSVPKFVFTRNFVLLLLAVLCADQISKSWALSALFANGNQIVAAPFLNFTPVWNSGISFGMLADFPQVTGYAIPAFAVLVVIWLYFQLDQLSGIQRLGAGLIAGGALGNVIDRLRFDKVVDFIDVHLLGYHWPAFNIADSAIFIGVVAWLYGIMTTPKSEGATHA
jgi:signal peptidase II